MILYSTTNANFPPSLPDKKPSVFFYPFTSAGNTALCEENPEMQAHITVASWQGDHTKAKEASFLQRCVKKTRHPQGKLTPVLEPYP